jgi:tetratricopeptide (TPR) repeat protein
MTDLIREGLWIPLAFLIAAFFYAAWIIYRNVDRLREKGHSANDDLSGVLVHYRVALEKIRRADDWIQAGDLDRAIEELTAVRASHATITTTDYFLGKAYLAKGQIPAAELHFRKFLESTHPYDETSRERIGEVNRLLVEIS